MTFSNKLLASLGFLVFGGALANASTIQQQLVFGPTKTDFNTTIGLFNPFNVALGTLTNVEIDEFVTINGTLQFTNTDTSPQSFFATLDSDVFVSQENGGLSNDTDVAFRVPVSGTTTLPAGTAGPVTPYSGGPQEASILHATDLADYEAGLFALPLSSLSEITIHGGGGNITAVQTNNGTVTVDVIYTYTAVGGTPEPGTMVLLGFGLVGLGLAGRKRFAR
jgi:hypothetical protein